MRHERCRCARCRRRMARRARRHKPVGVTRVVARSALSFLQKPEIKLLSGMMGLLGEYLEAKLGSFLVHEPGGLNNELTEEMRAEIKASIEADIGEIGKAPHPEALDPLLTVVDERQEGRSEVVREIANPRQS